MTDEQPIEQPQKESAADQQVVDSLDEVTNDPIVVDEQTVAEEQTVVDEQLLPKIVEAIMLTASKPMTIQQLQKILADDAPDKNALQTVLTELSEACEDRGVELVEVASGWRYQAKEAVTPWVSQLFEEKPQRYSRATLETLALIAYRQPITRGEIEEVRGVAVSSQIIRSLQEREWVKVVGHRDVPGRPAMYATTREFLDDLGLKSLENLPALADVRELGELNEDLELELPPELLASLTPGSSNESQENSEQAVNNESPSEQNAADDAEKTENTAQSDSTRDIHQEGMELSALEGSGSADDTDSADDTEEAPEAIDVSLVEHIGISDAVDGLIPSVAIEVPLEAAPVSDEVISVFDDHLDASDKVIDALNTAEENAFCEGEGSDDAVLNRNGEDATSDGINIDEGEPIHSAIDSPMVFDPKDSMPPSSLDDE